MHPPVSVTDSSYRWVILLVATLAQACACFFVQGIGALAPYIQQDLQLSTAQIGTLVSAAQLVPLVGLLVAGELLDRYSERRVVGLGTLVVAGALLAAVWARSYGTVLLFLLLLGAGYSTAQPGGSKSVARWFAAQQRGFAMGIRQAGLPLGGAVAALLLPYAATHWGWRSAFLVGGVIALAGALLFMAFYRTPASPPAAPKSAASGLRQGLLSRLRMLREPAMKNIMASGVSLVCVQYGLLIFTVLYLHERLQLRVSQAAMLLFVAQGAGVVGRVALAAWSDRCRSGRYFPVFVCLAASLGGLLLLLWLPLSTLPALALLLAWLGFFGFGWYGPWVAYVAESAPPEKTGFALGLAMAVNQLAIVLVPPVLGWMRDASGSYWLGWSLLAVLTALGLLLTRQRSQERLEPGGHAVD
jgi:predicted MFS family arabinose efflux permease